MGDVLIVGRFGERVKVAVVVVWLRPISKVVGLLSASLIR